MKLKPFCDVCSAYLLDHPTLKAYLKCPTCGFCKNREVSMPISKEELLMGRDKKYVSEYTQEISDNLDKLLIPINKIRDAYGKPMIVTSGWRPAEINAHTPGAAAHSKHQIGLAVDISDPVGDIRRYILANLSMIQELGLYMEDFNFTPDWCHFQLGAPASGHRIFIPNSNPPTCEVWTSGDYDHSFDT